AAGRPRLDHPQGGRRIAPQADADSAVRSDSVDMACAGETIENSKSGERVTFRRTTADTGGEYVEFDLLLNPNAAGARKHRHPQQSERFEVFAGTIKFKLGRKTLVARAGDVVIVPPGKKHRIQN